MSGHLDSSLVVVVVCMYVCMYVPTAPPKNGCDTRSIFKRSKAGLNLVFSFSKISCLNKAKEPKLPYNSTIAGERTEEFMPFT